MPRQRALSSHRVVPLPLVAFLLLCPVAASHAAESTPSARHLMLIDSARDLAAEVGAEVWPSWSEALFELLLVGDDREVLFGRESLPTGFEPLLGEPWQDSTAVRSLRGIGARAPVFPVRLLATMPAFGLPPTIVMGVPEATERTATQWILVLLHEHFHQWQMRDQDYFEATAELALAPAGDATGRWMLDYPFPYAEPAIAGVFERLSGELAALLRRSASEDIAVDSDEFWSGYRSWLATLEAGDARYLEFQLWQEGVARFVELRLAEAASARWRLPSALVADGGFEDFGVAACAAWERLFAQLESPDLAAQQRVAFYAFGAGLALLLDRTDAEWKSRYEAPRFSLVPALASD